MTSTRHYCKCGAHYLKEYQLREHIGICNPHWPRTSKYDEHAKVDREEWLKLQLTR